MVWKTGMLIHWLARGIMSNQEVYCVFRQWFSTFIALIYFLTSISKNLLSFTLCGLYLEKNKCIRYSVLNYGQPGWDAHKFCCTCKAAWNKIRVKAYSIWWRWDRKCWLARTFTLGIWKSMNPDIWAWIQRHMIWPNLNLNKKTVAPVWRMVQKEKELESEKLKIEP